MNQSEQAPAGVDPATPSPARMYDYMLAGKHNFQSDRDAVERFRAQMPDLGDAAWANRAFHQRAARWLAADRGIRQFIDIGSGLPIDGNTHDIVQAVAPGARVVYVDHDPMLVAYADELLTDDGSTAVIQADLRDPDALLAEPGLRALEHQEFEQHAVVVLRDAPFAVMVRNVEIIRCPSATDRLFRSLHGARSRRHAAHCKSSLSS